VNAHELPVGLLFDEACIAQARETRRDAMYFSVLSTCIAAMFSKDGAKALREQLEDMVVSVKPRGDDADKA